ncbi:PTS transporter subunit EIIC, partial [Amedibacillus dolichus]
KISLFGKNSPIPDFVQQWFDNMIPISITLFIGYILIYVFNFDFFAMVIWIFSPITDIAQTLPGFVLICFLPVLLYSFGISSWIITPITFTICLGAIAANTAAVEAGLPATNITTFEVIYCGWVFIGGQGGTLPLVLMMSRSKSQRLKAVGKATLVPSIFNINEPVIFGTPIAWNFTLIIPFLLNSLIIPIIVYLVLSAGWVSIPDTLFSIYQMPLPIATWLVCPEVQGLILFAVVVVINSLIWFPFFKAYEHQCLEEEAQQQDDFDLSLE